MRFPTCSTLTPTLVRTTRMRATCMNLNCHRSLSGRLRERSATKEASRTLSDQKMRVATLRRQKKG